MITVARRYAQAFYEEAEREGSLAQTDADMELIRASMEGSRDLVRLFESPIVSREKKERVIRQLFEDRLQPLTLRFLLLLVAKQREDLFPSIVQAYHEQRNRQQGIVEVRARAARPLDTDEAQKLTQTLERMTGQRVRLQVEQDPSILGGLIVRVGDTVYDGSVRHQLENLREQLEHGAAFRTNGAAPA